MSAADYTAGLETYNPSVSQVSEATSQLTARKVALIAFVLLLVAKWPVLDQPPVWDGSKTVFPAAITLAHHNFDLGYLLRQPSYFDGGPNTHGLSLVTWITAAAYWTLGDRPGLILPLLHLLHFAFAAGAIAMLWSIGRRTLGAFLALGLAATVAVFPMFFVQAGYLYMEMPILAFSAAAVHAWLARRDGRAAAWATASALVKPSGTIVTGALLLATLLTTGDLRKNWKDTLARGALLAAGPLMVAAAHFALRPKQVYGIGTIGATLGYLKSVPDLAILLGAFLLATLWLRPRGGDRVFLVCLAMTVSFFCFYLALVPLGSSVPILTRYYLQLFPFLLLGLLCLVAQRSRRAAGGLLLVAALFFLANREGHFYPDRGTTNFAITERSMAYVDLMELQDLGLRSLVEVAGETPVFYGLSESYRLAYPEMGHEQTPPANGHCIYNESPYFYVLLRALRLSVARRFRGPARGVPGAG